MTEITMQQIFTKQRLRQAEAYLTTKKNSCGSDGVMLWDIHDYFERNNLIDALLSGTYQPAPADRFTMQSAKGKNRVTYRLCAADRLIARVLADALSAELDGLFLPNCLAYRAGLGTSGCCPLLAEAANTGRHFALKLDIRDFFESVNLNKAEALLAECIADPAVLQLVTRYLYMPYTGKFKIETIQQGLVTGNPLSPLISNLYLKDFDNYLSETTAHPFYRFADDIAVFCGSRDTAQDTAEQCEAWLQRERMLALNEHKSGIFDIKNTVFLGFRLVGGRVPGSYEAVKNVKDNVQYESWHKEGLGLTSADYEIVSSGTLGVENGTLLFENDNRKVRLPVKDIQNLNIYGDVPITGRVMALAAGYGISISLFDRYGELAGRFVPENAGGRAHTFLNQAMLYNDPKKRLKLARLFVEAEIFNMRANIRYYRKHIESTALDEAVKKLADFSEQVKCAKAHQDLLLTEARARETYFSVYNIILSNERFRFTKRTRRPPRDPLNAMISFGNVVLYNQTANEIRKSSLDVRVGYLHATNRRAESLNLDIAEIFKPIVVDRVIFTLVNKRMVSEQLHFCADDEGVFLSDLGKKLFLREYYDKLNAEITVNNEKMTYRKLLVKEIADFADYVNGKVTAYNPYHYIL